MIRTKSQVRPRSVLIVDNCSESREVLRTVLARRGVTIYETDHARRGLDMVRQHHPGVVVLDAETDEAMELLDDRQFDAVSSAHHASLVVLGVTKQRGASASERCIVPKPYHYAPLIRKIEELLADSVAASSSDGAAGNRFAG